MIDWQQIALGDLLTRVRRKVAVEDGVSYSGVSVQMYGRGLGQKEPFTGGVSKYTTLNTVRENDVVLRTITAFEAPAGVARAEHDGTHVSDVFITYEVDQRALPTFLGLYFQTAAFWDEMQNRASGTVLRRKTVSDASFRAIPFALPPLPTQERIVEVISVVDEQVAALKVEADSLLRVRDAALRDMLSCGGDGWLCAPLSDAGRLTRGRRFVKSDYVEAGLGCIHYGQIYTDYGASATRTVTYLPESFRGLMSLAQPGDVVIAGTSENVEDVGKAVAWLGDDEVAVHDDCFIFRHDHDPKFVSYFFASPLFQHRKRQFTSETKVVRISAANLKKIVMPVPPRAEQERISGMADAVDAQVIALRAEAERLRQARAVLLSGLLDRTIDIESAELEV